MKDASSSELFNQFKIFPEVVVVTFLLFTNVSVRISVFKPNFCGATSI
jgi:hypothetical protein